MDERSTMTQVNEERAPNGNDGTTPQSPSMPLAKTDPAYVEAVFARVAQKWASTAESARSPQRQLHTHGSG